MNKITKYIIAGVAVFGFASLSTQAQAKKKEVPDEHVYELLEDYNEILGPVPAPPTLPAPIP